jgi:hypothetical protein
LGSGWHGSESNSRWRLRIGRPGSGAIIRPSNDRALHILFLIRSSPHIAGACRQQMQHGDDLV